MSKEKIYGFCKYDKTGNCKYAGNMRYSYGFMSGNAEYCKCKKQFVGDLEECPIKKENENFNRILKEQFEENKEVFDRLKDK